MAQKNKVLMGFSDLYVGEYIVNDDGTVTMGTPYRQKGAVGWGIEADSERNVFYADDIEYYVNYSGGTREGDLEVSMFDDEFKTRFLGYVKLDDGGLAEIKNPVKPHIFACWAIKGDVEGRRLIMYNGTLGNISREYATLEDTKEPVTESIPASFTGDDATGMTIVTYNPDDEGYDTLFTNPPAPALPSGESE